MADKSRDGSLLDKDLPKNLDAERTTLGSILVRNEAFAEIASILTPDSFALEAHRRVFRAMAKLFDARKPIDYVTVCESLVESGELESVGGVSFVTGLSDGLPQITHVAAYATIVKEKEIARKVILLSQHQAAQMLAGDVSPKECIQSGVQSFLDLLPPERGSGPKSVSEAINSYEGGLNALLQPHLRQRGIPTGFKRLDEMTGGLYPGELFIIGARPGVGKSAISANIALNIALKEHRTSLLFSLEMSRESILERLICSHARVDSTRFRLGYTNPEERRKLAKAAHEIAEAPIIIDDTSTVSVMDVIAKLRSVTSLKGKPDVVIVDYLQLLQAHSKFDSRTNEVNAMARMLKLTAKDHGVCMLTLSQLSRAPDKRPGGGGRPQLSDLRDGGEGDADIVGLLWREGMNKPEREDLRGLCDVILAKNRRGSLGTVKLVFLEAFTLFCNAAEDMEEPPEDWKNRSAGKDND